MITSSKEFLNLKNFDKSEKIGEEPATNIYIFVHKETKVSNIAKIFKNNTQKRR